MIQEIGDERWPEIFHCERGWWLIQGLLPQSSKAAGSIAIGLYSSRTCIPLLNQALYQETLQESGKVSGLTCLGHGTTTLE